MLKTWFEASASSDLAAVVAAAQRQRAHLRNPALDADRYLDVLLRQGGQIARLLLPCRASLTRAESARPIGQRPGSVAALGPRSRRRSPDRKPASTTCGALIAYRRSRSADRRPTIGPPTAAPFRSAAVLHPSPGHRLGSAGGRSQVPCGAHIRRAVSLSPHVGGTDAIGVERRHVQVMRMALGTRRDAQTQGRQARATGTSRQSVV